MKKLLSSLTALFLFAVAVFAQRGLHVNPVFEGNVVPGKQMVVTEVRGGDLVPYQLDHYRGVSFQANAELAGKVSRLVDADAAEAASVEAERAGNILTYALIQPKPSRRTNRYICYQARPIEDGWAVTLLYLEGPATLEDLRSMFEKQ